MPFSIIIQAIDEWRDKFIRKGRCLDIQAALHNLEMTPPNARSLRAPTPDPADSRRVGHSDFDLIRSPIELNRNSFIPL